MRTGWSKKFDWQDWFCLAVFVGVLMLFKAAFLARELGLWP